jgi:hypothetical protein
MGYTSYLGRTDLTRGLRNNNPGNLIKTNIKWQGEVANNTDGHFEQFVELRWGIRAMMRDIINDISEGTDTLTALINEYAPSSENDTASYIGFVSGLTGIGPDVRIQLTKPVVQSIVRAKIIMENGWSASDKVTDKDLADAFDILGVNLPGELISTEKKSTGLPQASSSSGRPCSHCSGTGYIA